MNALMQTIIAHRWLSVLIVCGLVAGFAPGALKVGFNSSIDMMLVEDDPERVFYNETRETFGDDVILSIVVKAEDIFEPRILQTIENLTADAEYLEQVNRVVSLTTVMNIRGREGFLDVDRLISWIPDADETEELARIRDDALYDTELFRDEVISADGKTSAVNIFVADVPGDGQFNERLTTAVAESIERELKTLGPNSGVEIYQTGFPKLKVDMLAYMSNDLMLLAPISFAVIFVVLLLLFRNLAAVVIPLVTGAASVVITVGFMGYLGFQFNPITAIIPLLLIVIGATEDIHLISEYGLALSRGDDKPSAIRRMSEKSGLAIALTTLTTFLGFSTIIFSEIPMLRQFGIATSFGILINFIVTILLVPHLLQLFPANRGLQWPDSAASGHRPFLARIANGVANFGAKRGGLIIAISVVIGGACLLGSTRIVVDTDYLNFFRDDAPIRQSFDDIGENLSGGSSFYIVLEAENDGDLKKPEILNPIVLFADHVEQLVDKVYGYPKLIRKIHQELGETTSDFPETSDQIAQYALLLDGSLTDRFIDRDYRTTCLFARMNLRGSHEIAELLPKIQSLAKSVLPPGIKMTITGELILVAQASDEIGKSIIENLLILFGAVAIVIAILFWSFKAGMLALIPNMLPILVGFGAMGLFGIHLSPGTFPVAMIAFGIAVDDTIHFMVRYYKELKTSSTETTAVKASVYKEFRPILVSTLALVLGFGVMALSDFKSTMEMGSLVALSLGFALLCDFFLTPVIFLMSPLVSLWDYLTLRIDRDSLKNSRLFEGMRNSEIKVVALAGEMCRFVASEKVITEGATDSDLYFVVKGRAKVFSTDQQTGEEIPLADLKRGDFFGEMSMVTKAPRSANVIAFSQLEVIRINEAVFDRIFVRHPRISAKLFRNFSRLLSERLSRETYRGRDRDPNGFVNIK
ncbi:MAG: putative RND superfamily exporter protein [Verrucomicrobiales bacterium]|jgi:predicted RND superfamily exporter protein